MHWDVYMKQQVWKSLKNLKGLTVHTKLLDMIRWSSKVNFSVGFGWHSTIHIFYLSIGALTKEGKYLIKYYLLLLNTKCQNLRYPSRLLVYIDTCYGFFWAIKVCYIKIFKDLVCSKRIISFWNMIKIIDNGWPNLSSSQQIMRSC